MSLRTRGGLGLTASMLIVVAACNSGTPSTAPTAVPPAVTPAPTATAVGATPGVTPPALTQPPVVTPAPTEPPAPAQSMTYALDGDFTYLTNSASDVPTANAIAWLYDALYSYKDDLTVIPGLASSLATISPDGLTWTIPLVKNAVFQPTGTTMTADDVVFSWQLSNSPNCPFNPSICIGSVTVDDGTGTLVHVLKDIKKIDDSTVEFDLGAKYAPFATLMLPGIAIDSMAAVKASFDRFEATAGKVTAAQLKVVADAIAAEETTPTGPPDDTGAATVNYAQFRAQMEALLNTAAIPLPAIGDYTGADGTVDEEGLAEAELPLFTQLNTIVTSTSIDQLAAAYTLLDIQRNPVGTGPFYVAAPGDVQAGQSVTVTANPLYFKGAPLLSKIFMPIIKDDIAAAGALAAGQIDWKYSFTTNGLDVVSALPNVKLAEYQDFGWFGMFFNNRPGSLFADLNLRKAAALCFDKAATVTAATAGRSTAIDGDIPPASWAYNPNVTKYDHNIDMANQLIQASGWVKGADGVYAKDGVRLETIVPVRAGKPDRIQFMQLWSSAFNQDCGGAITVKETDFGTLLHMIENWPLTNPYTNKPFDLYFGGFGASFDPDPYSTFHSSQCLTADTAQGPAAPYNFECYKSDAADAAILKGLQTYDQNERKTAYQAFEQQLSDDLPVLFAWSDIAHQGVSEGLNGATPWTPENMTGPLWYYQYEKIHNDASAQ